MHRISVTTVEKFRRYMAGVSDFDTEESLLESIKGIFRGNPKTAFGSAYHAILERNCTMYTNGVIWANGHYFTPEQTAPAIAYCRQHPSMTHEMNVRKVYETPMMPIQVTGRVDAIQGLAIRDAKTKFSTPDMHEYMDSAQWKFYLDMLESDVLYYDIFEVLGFDDEKFVPNVLNPEVSVKECETLQCLRTANMEGDLHDLLGELVEYLAFRNLFQFLKPALNDIRWFP